LRAPSKLDPLIGRDLMGGEFQIRRKIGNGGMGAVYEGLQPSMQRKVAIKVLHKKLRERADIESRFHREAAAMRRLRHPSIAQVFFYGQEDVANDRLLYIVMEYVEGRNLHQIVQGEGKLPVARAVAIVAQAARALAEAHELGIVHRDLKPENIMVCNEPAGANLVKVLDFGLAKVTEQEMRPESVVLTREGMVFGTPEFMSPEQARGQVLDPRTDIYSLAVILYEAISGKLPFDSKHPNEFLQAHIEREPIPLSKRVPELGVGPALEAVIRKALDKKPRNRHQTVEEFASALEKALVDDAERPGADSDPVTPPETNTGAVCGVIAAAVGLAATALAALR
jgi:serine/threonine-protein kinase